MDVSQGKLSICYRTDITLIYGDYIAIMVLNAILGGGPDSKLFNEVREKNSLAYYSHSYYDKYKGLLVMASGVDFSNFDKASELSIAQVEDIKNGIISEDEIQNAKNHLINTLKEIKDNQFNFINYLSGMHVYGVLTTLNETMDEISKVDLNRIVEASKNLKLKSIHKIVRKKET